MPKGLDILFLSGIRWEFSFQRHQQVAGGLARRNRVLFFEIGLSPANLIKEPAVTFQHWKSWLRGPEQIQPRLFRATAPPVFPLGRSALAVNRINQEITFRAGRRAGEKLGISPDLVWISDPYFSLFAREYKEAVTVFDWIHDEENNSASGLDRVYRRLREETLRNSEIIFTPSRVIYQRHSRNDPRFHLLPHGADLAFFKTLTGRRPEELEGIPSPIIGFIGTVGPTVDPELIEFLARERKNWSFVLIGEIRSDVGGLRSYPNIHFLGPKEREELPRYLDCFAAGIIPYRVSPATATVHPVKTYEYLAAGLPVVATRLPELLPLAEIVRLANGGEDFLRALTEVLAADSPEEKTRRKDYARKNSWENRVEEIEGIIAGARAGHSPSRGKRTRSVTSEKS